MNRTAEGATRTKTPYHRSIVVIDVEGSATRTNPARARLRDSMYDLLEEALASVGIIDQWREELVDRGDGVIALIRPVDEAPKTLLLAEFVPTLSRRLVAHNMANPKDALRMRAAMHAGEVLFDDRGCFGESVDLTCRLLDAPALKWRLAAAHAPLILVVSEEIYRAVVRHGYDGIDADAFEPLVQVQLGTVAHRGWVTVPDTGPIPCQRMAG
jgi:class 3 adenylate cyclase